MPGIVGPNRRGTGDWAATVWGIAYNQGMSSHVAPSLFTPWCRTALGATVAALLASHAWAQAPAATQEPVTTLEQKTERITHEDAGSRIEELRVGGQTRSIEVHTNTNVPGYRVEPIDPSRAQDGKTGSGPSSWRVLNF